MMIWPRRHRGLACGEPGAPTAHNGTGSRPACVQGFTVVELLVVIAVVVLLVGLSSLALSSIGTKRVEIRDLAVLRSHSQSLSAYTSDNRDAFPLFLEPVQHAGDVTDASGLTYTQFSYFEMSSSWHIFLGATGHAPASPVHESFYPHGFLEGTERYSRFTPFAYPCAFVADPKFWNRETRLGREFVANPRDPVQFRATRASEVAYPSSKSLVVQTWSYETDILGRSGRGPRDRSGRVRAAMADGSGRPIGAESRLGGYSGGDGGEYMDLGAMHFDDAPVLLHTVDGVRGRDLR